MADEMERLRLERYDPVIYCYELQLHPSVHRKGLGKRLMQMLELVVRQWHALSCGLLKQEGLAAAAGSSLTTCLVQLCTRWAIGGVPQLVVLVATQALKFGMHMLMLTVQKSNVAALSFYSALGYKQHPSCPERNAFDDFDGHDPGHRILFKDLRR